MNIAAYEGKLNFLWDFFGVGGIVGGSPASFSGCWGFFLGIKKVNYGLFLIKDVNFFICSFTSLELISNFSTGIPSAQFRFI